VAERAELELVGPKLIEWMKRIEKELDNIESALEWSTKRMPRPVYALASASFDFLADLDMFAVGAIG